MRSVGRAVRRGVERRCHWQQLPWMVAEFVGHISQQWATGFSRRVGGKRERSLSNFPVRLGAATTCVEAVLATEPACTVIREACLPATLNRAL